MTRLAFTVPGVPQPAGSKRAFKAGARVVVTDDNRKAKPWQGEVRAAAVEAMTGRALLAGPLVLTLTFQLPRPKGHYGARGLRPSAPRYPIVRPDVLKLARAVEDALTGVVWRDDAQIVTEHLFKLYGEPASVTVEVSTT